MSDCKKYREQSLLHFYGELSEAESAALQAHIEDCPACQSEFDDLSSFHAIAPPPSTETTDPEIRRVLRQSIIRQIRTSRSGQSSLRNQWMNLFSPASILRAGIAVVLVVLGYTWGSWNNRAPIDSSPDLIGNLLTANDEIISASSAINPVFGDIQRISYNKESGTIELQYTTVNDIKLQGGITDPSVKHVLQRAFLSEENPAIRLHAVKALGEAIESTPEPDTELIQTLAFLLNRENNTGIRLRVLKTMKTLPPNTMVRTALMRILLEENDDAMRIEALHALQENQVSTTDLNLLRYISNSDSSTYVRKISAGIVQELENKPTTPEASEGL